MHKAMKFGPCVEEFVRAEPFELVVQRQVLRCKHVSHNLCLFDVFVLEKDSISSAFLQPSHQNISCPQATFDGVVHPLTPRIIHEVHKELEDNETMPSLPWK